VSAATIGLMPSLRMMLAALAERVDVALDRLDVFELAPAAPSAGADRQEVLADDVQAGIRQQMMDVGDAAGDRVLDRDHAEVGLARGSIAAKRVLEGRAGQRLGVRDRPRAMAMWEFAPGSPWNAILVRDELRRPVLAPFVIGLGLAGCFLAAAFVLRPIPFVAGQVNNVLDHAAEGSLTLVAVVTVVNGVAEEVFFRGAVYAAVPGDRSSSPPRPTP
jgi:hypothetical protein